jgi:ferritin
MLQNVFNRLLVSQIQLELYASFFYASMALITYVVDIHNFMHASKSHTREYYVKCARTHYALINGAIIMIVTSTQINSDIHVSKISIKTFRRATA